ncbi:protein of unknown function [Moritella yayanosii]|uniref:Uncharacterized protein n=1 Tax=Moritella yayanosii TaxID=69539 RepID=A0A330M1K2_9GAMM|nr:protein of unknown function [Moritella yayanosii]
MLTDKFHQQIKKVGIIILLTTYLNKGKQHASSSHLRIRRINRGF